MPYLKPEIDVNQAMIISFDDLVAPDSTARIIKRFVDSVDLSALGFLNTDPAAEGRPSYPPANMENCISTATGTISAHRESLHRLVD